MKGDGSRVASLACSSIPREAEEPGKETEKVTPPPPQRPLGLGEQLPAQTTPRSPSGWRRLNPSGAGLRESGEQHRCTHTFSRAWPKCCVGLPLAVLLRYPHPLVLTQSPRLPEAARIQLLLFSQSTEPGKWGASPRGVDIALFLHWWLVRGHQTQLRACHKG